MIFTIKNTRLIHQGLKCSQYFRKTNGLFLREKWIFLRFPGISNTESHTQEMFLKILLSKDAFEIWYCSQRNWCGNFSRLFCKVSSLIFKTNHTNKHFLRISANQINTAGKQLQQLTFPYVFTTIEKVYWYIVDWNAATAFCRRQLSRKILTTSKVCLHRFIKFALRGFLQEHYSPMVFQE